MPQLEPIHLKITGSAEGLSAALREARQKTSLFDSSISNSAGKLGALGAIAGPVAATAATALAAITAAAAAAATAVGKVAENMKAIDAAADAANRLGVTFAELRGIRFSLAKATGLEDGAIDAAITKLEVNLGQAAKDGSGQVYEALKSLGLNAGDLMAAGPLEALARIADRVSQISDRSQQAQIVFELLGKSGLTIAAALRQSGEELRTSYEWGKLNLGLTESQVAQVGIALDRWDETFAVIKHVVEVMSAELAPVAELIARDMKALADEIGGVEVAARMVADTMAALYGYSKDLFELWKGTNPIIQWARILSGEDLKDIAKDAWGEETWRFDGMEKQLARLEELRRAAREVAQSGGVRVGFSDAEATLAEAKADGLAKGLEEISRRASVVEQAAQSLEQRAGDLLSATTDRAEQIRRIAELRQQENSERLAAEQLQEIKDLGTDVSTMVTLLTNLKMPVPVNMD